MAVLYAHSALKCLQYIISSTGMQMWGWGVEYNNQYEEFNITVIAQFARLTGKTAYISNSKHV